MRLDFNVLWIEDQPGNVRNLRENLSIRIDREGFRLHVFEEVSFEDASQHLAEDVFLDNIDLVLVDYDLGKGTSGDDAVKEIRGRVPFKDIIFYSAKSTANLKKMMFDKGVEGVFIAHREELAEKVAGVFEALVKKVLDIDHCRGIVMGATSDIDQIVLECLKEISPKLTQEHNKKAAVYALAKLDEKLAKFHKIRDELAAIESIEMLLSSHEAFTAVDRLGLLKKVLGIHYGNAHHEARNIIGQYANEVPKRRNVLGHMRLIATGGTRTLNGKGARQVTADELREFRKILITYRDAFDQIVDIIVANAS